MASTQQRVLDFIRRSLLMPSTNDIKLHMLNKHMVSRDDTSKALYVLVNRGKIVKQSLENEPGIVFYSVPPANAAENTVDEQTAEHNDIHAAEPPETVSIDQAKLQEHDPEMLSVLEFNELLDDLQMAYYTAVNAAKKPRAPILPIDNITQMQLALDYGRAVTSAISIIDSSKIELIAGFDQLEKLLHQLSNHEH